MARGDRRVCERHYYRARFWKLGHPRLHKSRTRFTARGARAAAVTRSPLPPPFSLARGNPLVSLAERVIDGRVCASSRVNNWLRRFPP